MSSDELASPASVLTDLKTAHWDLLWHLQLSALYHLKRERFLDGADRAAKAVAVLGGAAAFSQWKTEPTYGLWFTGAVAVVSTLSLVYGFSTKARRHAELARDFKNLEGDLVSAGAGLTQATIDQITGKMIKLESSEPASLGALVTQCHNELCTAQGRLTEVTELPCHHRLLKNWLDFDQSITAPAATK